MTQRKTYFLLACLLITGMLAPLSSSTAASPRPVREHLTPQEVDLVKDAQTLDKRTAVFIKAIERRLLVLTGQAAANAKQIQKDMEKWGELPTGTRAELIGDIAKILDEAIDNIDDVSTRDENNPLIAKSLRLLSAASTRFIEQLTAMRDKSSGKEENQAIEQTLEYAQSVIDAASKLPPEVKTKGKNRT